MIQTWGATCVAAWSMHPALCKTEAIRYVGDATTRWSRSMVTASSNNSADDKTDRCGGGRVGDFGQRGGDA
eukprot:327786-Prorocentrum_lima.AAC.1